MERLTKEERDELDLVMLRHIVKMKRTWLHQAYRCMWGLLKGRALRDKFVGHGQAKFKGALYRSFKRLQLDGLTMMLVVDGRSSWIATDKGKEAWANHEKGVN
jgi:hypothetical protein